MNLYLIDYENVTETGLSGTNELTADDHVIVFYSAQIKNISFEKHVEIAQCPATFEYIKIQKTGKTKIELNNRFVKAFQTPKGSNIYNHVKEIYEQYMKSLT